MLFTPHQNTRDLHRNFSPVGTPLFEAKEQENKYENNGNSPDDDFDDNEDRFTPQKKSFLQGLKEMFTGTKKQKNNFGQRVGIYESLSKRVPAPKFSTKINRGSFHDLNENDNL